MNYKLIFNIALFGFVIGILNILGFSGDFEWLFWLIFLIGGSLLITKKGNEKLFLSASICGFLFAAFVYATEAIGVQQYIESNPDMRERLTSLPDGLQPGRYLISLGLIVSIINGFIMGCLALGFNKFFRKSNYLSKNLS